MDKLSSHKLNMPQPQGGWAYISAPSGDEKQFLGPQPFRSPLRSNTHFTEGKRGAVLFPQSQQHGRVPVEPRATDAWASVLKGLFWRPPSWKNPSFLLTGVQQVGGLQAVPRKFLLAENGKGGRQPMSHIPAAPFPKSLKVNSGFFSQPGKKSRN